MRATEGRAASPPAHLLDDRWTTRWRKGSVFHAGLAGPLLRPLLAVPSGKPAGDAEMSMESCPSATEQWVWS